ncbi:hypothetical protein BC827DRAFT_1153912 [Russula dissimulans]|nr:hypothetical protein BC827DRAFT_1153912 [Russula dissimulans]
MSPPGPTTRSYHDTKPPDQSEGPQGQGANPEHDDDHLDRTLDVPRSGSGATRDGRHILTYRGNDAFPAPVREDSIVRAAPDRSDPAFEKGGEGWSGSVTGASGPRKPNWGSRPLGARSFGEPTRRAADRVEPALINAGGRGGVRSTVYPSCQTQLASSHAQPAMAGTKRPQQESARARLGWAVLGGRRVGRMGNGSADARIAPPTRNMREKERDGPRVKTCLTADRPRELMNPGRFQVVVGPWAVRTVARDELDTIDLIDLFLEETPGDNGSFRGSSQGLGCVPRPGLESDLWDDTMTVVWVWLVPWNGEMKSHHDRVKRKEGGEETRQTH